jgi:ATP-dependent helicase/nuclease subunit A
LNAYKEKLAVDNHYKYDVLSNESAFLKNADVVAIIIKILSFLNLPEDTVNAASLAYDYLLYSKQNIDKLTTEPDKEMFNPLKILPSEFITNIDKFRNLPVGELFEQLVILFGFNKDVKNLPYLQALSDCIAEYSANNPAGISGFLEFWEENQHKLSVSVSENQDAIRVMTIHKSKGLEFANVIIPFCNLSLDYKPMNQPTIWCSSDIEPFNKLEFLPVRYSSNLSKTIFASDYYLEKSQSMVDNLNLLYVAFTRVSENLFVFAPKPAKEEKISTTGDLMYSIMNTGSAQISEEYPSLNFQNSWKKDENIFEYGSLCSAKIKEKEPVNEISLEQYSSYEIKEKLRQKFTAVDFWQLSDENQLPKRAYGNLMHRLFQEIKTEHDVEKAVETLILNGFISKDEQSEIMNEVKAVISQKPYNEWFNGSWQVLNEPGIVVPNEPMHRPDRVMKKDGQVLVVDYKFGRRQSDSYKTQVKEYMNYIQQMGETGVQGVVWYVNMNRVENVE